VSLYYSRNEALRLEVTDDGLGFDPEKIREGGQGLQNIAARAKRLGAHCQVWSKPHQGTRIIFEIQKKGSYATA
jgi:signal transduction histidine kinase